MTDPKCVFGSWTCYNPHRRNECIANKEKAEKFDRYNLHLLSLEDVGVWGAINKLDAKLETVREFVLGRREDIEKDIEDLGMLKPVLEYFLEG